MRTVTSDWSVPVVVVVVVEAAVTGLDSGSGLFFVDRSTGPLLLLLLLWASLGVSTGCSELCSTGAAVTAMSELLDVGSGVTGSLVLLDLLPDFNWASCIEGQK